MTCSASLSGKGGLEQSSELMLTGWTTGARGRCGSLFTREVYRIFPLNWKPA